MRRLLSSLAIASLLSAPLAAQEKPSTFVPVWANDGAPLAKPALDEAMAACQAQQAQPEHIVVLIHGYDTTREKGRDQFGDIAPRVRASFAKGQKTVLVVGLQWDSAVPGGKTPWKADEAYKSMVPRARSVGHAAARQLVFRLQKQYPRARIHLLAHSMGCEVAAACALPEMAYTDKFPAPRPAFLPKLNAPVNLVALAGSDLDYDVWYKTKVSLGTKKPRIPLLWMTVPWYAGDIRDNTLQIRKVSRGMGGGSAFPRMTEAQYNFIFKNRAAVFDDKSIPQGHDFDKYYSSERVDSLAQAAVSLSDAQAPKPVELQDAERILALPARAEALQPALDSATFTGQTYALWRMECLLDGSPRHMSDGTLEQVAALLRNTPRKVWDAFTDSKCKTVRAKYWPTEKQLERAGAPAWAKPR